MDKKLTVEQELAVLRAENEKLKADANKSKDMTMKVSTKGALSIYGLGRFPVTLYKEQWTRLLGASESIKSFIVANDKDLRGKEDK